MKKIKNGFYEQKINNVNFWVYLHDGQWFLENINGCKGIFSTKKEALLTLKKLG